MYKHQTVGDKVIKKGKEKRRRRRRILGLAPQKDKQINQGTPLLLHMRVWLSLRDYFFFYIVDFFKKYLIFLK